MERAAVFLDRDGVLNRVEVRCGKPFAPRDLRNFRLLPGAAAAVERLKAAGFLVVVTTNQPDIGNGLVDAAVVEAMHARLRDRVAVDDVRVCPHAQTAGCACRKPRPGLLLEASRDWGIDLVRSFMVGDRAGDVEAGHAAGCRCIFIDRQYCEPIPSLQIATVASLASAVSVILRQSGVTP